MDDEDRCGLELGSLVDDIPARFSCGGTRALVQPIRLRLIDGTTVSFPGKNVAELAARAHPAAFGHGKKTRHDPSIRSGLQLAGDDVDLAGFDPDTAGILQAIHGALGHDGPAIDAELHSINLYGRGGHFARHKDTPRGDAFGTLVVRLPSAFEGGVLDLGFGGRRRRFDWAEGSGGRTLSWAAFFADADHEIATVTSGWRVTVTYRLRQRGRPSAWPPLSPATDALRAYLAGLAAGPGRPTSLLRFRCRHLYPATRETFRRRRIGADDLALLRGRDREVTRAALDAGLGVDLVRFLADDRFDELFGELEAPVTRGQIDRLPEQLTPEHLEDELLLTAMDDRSLAVGRPGDGEYAFTREYSPTDYFGNEASDVDFYVFGALEVRFPGPPARGALQVAHASFGVGEVLEASGEGTLRKLRVRFADGGERTILERFLVLR